jgi:hypothetical protein
MFKNLTSEQKYMGLVLAIIALILLALTLYFALSKKSCPTGKTFNPPSFLKFTSRADPPAIPWITPTYYKYSYVNNSLTPPNNEGQQSNPSDKVVSTTQTNPIIQVTLMVPYSIKIYRAVDDGTGNPGTFNELKVTVGPDGTFTDTNNPSPAIPPPPTNIPIRTGWGGGGGGVCSNGTTSKCTGNCTPTQVGQCTAAGAPWSCYDGTIGCSDKALTLEGESGCKKYCLNPSPS